MDTPHAYRLGAWMVQPSLHRLDNGERRVRVKPKSMAVLNCLAEQAGEVLPRQVIMDTVWSGQAVGEEVLTQAIAELRRAFGDDAKQPRFIETVPRRGYRLVAPVSSGTERPDGFGRATPLVGRDSEQARLHAALDRAMDGSGTLVLIAGEPGIGKTRLADAARDRGREAGCLALEARCPEDGGVPYLPFVMVLEQLVASLPRDRLAAALGETAPEIARLVPRVRHILGDLPPPLQLPADQERRFLFNAIVEFVENAAGATPLCVIVDDLQWAGPGSVELLMHLVPLLSRMPVLLVGTFRDTELTDRQPFFRALEFVTRERCGERIDLGDLQRAEVAAMLESLAGSFPPEPVVSAFLDVTNGNPFFVEELFRYLSGHDLLFEAPGRWREKLELDEGFVPESVRLVILKRISRLDECARDLLMSAAVHGRSSRVDLLRAMLGASPDEFVAALDDAERAGVMRADPRQRTYVFEHDLVRHALLSQLSHARRCQLHLHCARTLESMAGPDPESQAGEIARHLFSAGALADRESLLRWSMTAGQQALEAAAFEDALAHFDRASGLADEGDDTLQARIAHQRGNALRGVERWDDAVISWQEALHRYEQVGDPEGASVTIDYLVGLAVWAGDWEAAEALVTRGLEMTGSEPSASRHRILCYLGMIREATRDGEGSAEALRETREIAEVLDDDTALGKTLLHEGIGYWIRMVSARHLRELREAIAVNERARNLWDLPVAIWLCAAGLLSRGEWRAVEALVDESEPMTTRAGHGMAQAMCGHSRTWARLLRTGGIAAFETESLACAEQIRRLLRHPGLSALDAGLARYWRGDWVGAEAALEAAALDTRWPYTDSLRGAALRIAAHTDAPRARRMIEATAPVLATPPRIHGQWRLLACTVEAWATMGMRDPAADAYEWLAAGRRSTGAVELLYSEQLFDRILGIAAACGGAWDAAESHFEAALQLAERLPNVIDRPEVRRWHAWMLISRGRKGDQERARILLEAARAEFAALGMDRHAALASEQLAMI
ncbi:MAG: AAA family ATPase [Gammaproteobacteria bacterium]